LQGLLEFLAAKINDRVWKAAHLLCGTLYL